MSSSRRSLAEEGSSRAGSSGRPVRRAGLSSAIADNTEGLGMKVIAVMVQRYGVLCRELWDLNRESDMGSRRGVTYDNQFPTPVYESIISNDRYKIDDLTIGTNVTVMPVLPNTLRRLHLYGFRLLPLPASLLELDVTSDSSINQPLVLPATLQKLKLNAPFHHPITLPVSLISLYIGPHYSHPIALPVGLKELRFHPSNVINELVTLPPSLTSVVFSASYNQPVVLPNGIQEVGVGRHFTHDIAFPASVKRLFWYSARPVIPPPNLLEVTFGSAFDRPITFPSSLTKVIFLGELGYSHPITFPPGVLEVGWSRQYAGPLVLPEGLRKLTWGTGSETDDNEFPASLEELVLTRAAQITLPQALVRFSFSDDGNTHVDLPASVQHVTWFPNAGNTFTHPTRLPHLTVRCWRGRKVDLSKYKIDKVTIGIEGNRIDRIYLPRKLKVLEITGSGRERVFESTLDVPKGCQVIGGTLVRSY